MLLLCTVVLSRCVGYKHRPEPSPTSMRLPTSSAAAPLSALRSAVLGWPGSAVTTPAISLAVNPASAGGHVLLGRNGAGKTLVGSALASAPADSSHWVHGGALERRDGWSARSVSQVSFESHEALLDEGGTVYRALGVPPGTTPSKAAKFLIVRFGLHGLLYRPVTAISTGEIRKVLLARALATRPSLLVLDNAFDGLDVPSRAALAELISTTLKGFRQLLVQGVDASAAAHTQVLLITHRAEEIVDEFTTVSFLRRAGSEQASDRSASIGLDSSGGLDTEDRQGRQADRLLDSALGNEARVAPHNLPSTGEVHALWGAGGAAGTTLVEARGLRVSRGEAVLLGQLDWRVRRGQHWLIAGGNGAGKSTLSKLLATQDGRRQGAEGMLQILGARVGAAADMQPSSSARLQQREDVGWVSTELHLSMARSGRRASEILAGAVTPGTSDASIDVAARDVARWLGLNDALLGQPFSELSQGEQKLVLVGAALATRPALLVLDEPCQGLDLISRRRVLGLVQHVCNSSNVTLVYITHYYEEVVPCVTHVMHLRGGRAAFTGERRHYEESGLISLGNAQPSL